MLGIAHLSILIDKKIRCCTDRLNPPILFEGGITIASKDLQQEEVDRCRSMWLREGVNVNIFGYLDRVGSATELNLMPYNSAKRKLIGCDLNRPFERICVLSNGDCVICSQDWKREVVLGNVIESNIESIWNNENYRILRGQISGDFFPGRFSMSQI